MKISLAIALLCSILFSQILYEEYFTGGSMQLDWHPWFTDSLGIGDSMGVINDTTTPGGDDWAGRISNEYMGMAGLTYAGVPSLTNYSIEAWIYTRVSSASGGPYNGITMRMDMGANAFYSLVSDFDTDARLRLRVLVGATPTVIRDWSAGEIPGGVPTTSSWHKLKLMMIADSIWAYYDDIMLPGCPYIDNTVAQGYFGVYTFHFSDTVSTKCDNIVVRLAQSGIYESRNETPTSFEVYPNPFRNHLTIKFQISNDFAIRNPQSAISSLATCYSLLATLKIYDATGRMVRDFPRLTVNGKRSTVIWDGTDDSGRKLPAGIYFVHFEAGDYKETEKVILLR